MLALQLALPELQRAARRAALPVRRVRMDNVLQPVPPALPRAARRAALQQRHVSTVTADPGAAIALQVISNAVVQLLARAVA